MAAAIGTLLALGIIAIAIATFSKMYCDNKNQTSTKTVIFLAAGIAIFFLGMMFDMASKLQFNF